jgi:hypothetical protein
VAGNECGSRGECGFAISVAAVQKPVAVPCIQREPDDRTQTGKCLPRRGGICLLSLRSEAREGNRHGRIRRASGVGEHIDIVPRMRESEVKSISAPCPIFPDTRGHSQASGANPDIRQSGEACDRSDHGTGIPHPCSEQSAVESLCHGFQRGAETPGATDVKQLARAPARARMRLRASCRDLPPVLSDAARRSRVECPCLPPLPHPRFLAGRSPRRPDEGEIQAPPPRPNPKRCRAPHSKGRAPLPWTAAVSAALDRAGVSS